METILIMIIVTCIALIIIGIWLFKNVRKDLQEYNTFLNNISDDTKSSYLKSDAFKQRKFQLMFNLNHIIMKIRIVLFALIIAAIGIATTVVSSCDSNKQSVVVQQYEEKISQKDCEINMLNDKIDSLQLEIVSRDAILIYEDSLKQSAAEDYNRLIFEIDDLKVVNKNLQNAINLQNEMIKSLKN